MISNLPVDLRLKLHYKEVFLLFDRDADGVLSLTECAAALHTLGRRLTGNHYSWK